MVIKMDMSQPEKMNVSSRLWRVTLLPTWLLSFSTGVAVLVSSFDETLATPRHLHRPTPSELGSRFVPARGDDGDSTIIPPRMSIANMTCAFATQPLNHFVPRGTSPTYQQRYCVYNDYTSQDDDDTAPIFFYTGNESPLEQYINHTGIIWELAPVLGARIVFAEHRYEGKSLPTVDQQCLSYASTMQVLADYADLLRLHLNPDTRAPVIVFGGSYGGMLSAWFRQTYPHLVVGAIAASAPLGGFPQVANHRIDGSAQVLGHGLAQSYPPDREDGDNNNYYTSATENHCGRNLLATWPLLTWLVQQGAEESKYIGDFLQDMFQLCEPYDSLDPDPLLEFAKSLWFDLAEGSFPYPSNYIPFALLHKDVKLPAWPMQAACWKASQLHQDWNVKVVELGDASQVHYTVSYGDSNLTLHVDWDSVMLYNEGGGGHNMKTDQDVSTTTIASLQSSKDVIGLLTSVRNAIGVWHNVTKDVRCYNVSDAAPNDLLLENETVTAEKSRSRRRRLGLPEQNDQNNDDPDNRDDASWQTTPAAQTCRDKIRQVGSWEPLCCNDEMNLVVTEAEGLGRDFFWPPSLPRGVTSYQDMMQHVTLGPCPDPEGLFGYSKEDYDPWSTWLDTYYGTSTLTTTRSKRGGSGGAEAHSNIIYSNGLLDPWAAGGIYATNPFDAHTNRSRGIGSHKKKYHGPMVQNITDRDVIALIIEFGGHHTDLMYSHKLDPKCVTKARSIENTYIRKWISEWNEGQSQH